MSDTNQEPTMEEILASIRRIISEDDAPAEGEAPAEAGPAAAAPAAAEPLSDLDFPAAESPPLASDEDVLELTDRVDEPVAPIEPLAMSDLEVVAPLQPQAETDLPPLGEGEHLVGDPAAWSAASAFEKLERGILMPAAGRTLEDVVRELLRPMMKAWLDENLPQIVEQQVAAEVERIARLRRQS
jgi:cell pole-organizing protein PopZ